MTPAEREALARESGKGEITLRPLGGSLERGAERGASVQRTELGYTTAVRVAAPRDMTDVSERAMDDAQLLEEDAWYSIRFGSGRAEGGTIKLARSLISIWGNCAVRCNLIDESPDGSILMEATFIDLETGLNLALQYYGYIKKPPEDSKFNDGGENAARWKAMQFAGQQSRAVRNVILAALPAWLVKGAISQAKLMASKKLLNGVPLNEARATLVDRWKKYDINEEILVAFVGKPVPQWTAADCVDLSSSLKATGSGETTADEVFVGVLEHRELIEQKTGRDALNLGEQATATTTTATATARAEPTKTSVAPSSTGTATATTKTAMGTPPCPVCGNHITLTGAGTYRVHGPKDKRCDGSGDKPPTTTATETPPAQDAGGDVVEDGDDDSGGNDGGTPTPTPTDQGSLNLADDPFEGQ